jgi:hypothetical protein
MVILVCRGGCAVALMVLCCYGEVRRKTGARIVYRRGHTRGACANRAIAILGKCTDNRYSRGKYVERYNTRR